MRRSALALLIAAAAIAAVAAAEETPFVLIVHPANVVRELSHETVEKIYRRRERAWADGTPIVAINLPAGDPLREAFTETVLHTDPDSMATYWNRMYFQGVVPPIVLRSSAAVVAYVRATPGAIGYVPAGEATDGVAVVEFAGGR